MNEAPENTACASRLDLIAVALIMVVIALAWFPTLATGRNVAVNDDFLLHCGRHEAVRRSLLQHHTLPLRSHWFGGGYPTIGEPEDPALNPLVLLSVMFGAPMGLKLIGLVAVLVSALSTYALARYVLQYTWWGALFCGLIVGTSRFIPDSIAGGNIGEFCTAYVPLCLLLIGLACRGRRAALALLPFVLYIMLSTGKQGFFTAVLFLVLFCLLDAVPALTSLGRNAPAGGRRARALMVLGVALAAAFLVGMVRVLPLLEFLSAKGGLAGAQVYPYATRHEVWYPSILELLLFLSGSPGGESFTTIGWLPLALFAISVCCFWRRALPWVIVLGLFGWLAVGDRVPVHLFALVDELPIFNAMPMPLKFIWFCMFLPVAVVAGQFFWLLRRLPRRWMEHVAAAAITAVAVSWLFSQTTWIHRNTYTGEMPNPAGFEQQEFFNVHGLDLPRDRTQPPRALAYANLLHNVGTIDWYTAMPMAENAVPRYLVDAENNGIPNPAYRGEVYFEEQAESGSDAEAGYEARGTFAPNSITVPVTVPEPGTLVINQNYHPAWRPDRGELLDKDGLLAIRLGDTGAYTVHLRYLPRSFVVGLVVTVLSTAACLLACRTRFVVRRLCPDGEGGGREDERGT